MCVHACVYMCVYLDAHRVCVSASRGVECHSNGARRIQDSAGKDGDESLGPRPSVDLLCILCHTLSCPFSGATEDALKDNGHPCFLARIILYQCSQMVLTADKKAPWLTHSISYPMKIHALHKRHILTLSRLTSRFFLPPVSFRHLLRITLPNTSQLLLEFLWREGSLFFLAVCSTLPAYTLCLPCASCFAKHLQSLLMIDATKAGNNVTAQQLPSFLFTSLVKSLGSFCDSRRESEGAILNQ